VACVERSVEQLQTLAQRSAAPASIWARVAVAAVGAQQLRRQGPVGRADRLLSEAIASLPSDAPAPLRLLFVSTPAKIKQQSGKHELAVGFYQEAAALAEALAVPAWRQVDARSSLAYTLFLAGQAERAEQVNGQVLAMARAADDVLALAIATRTEGILKSEHGEPAELQALMQAAIGLAHRAGAERDEVLSTAYLARPARRAKWPTRWRPWATPVARSTCSIASSNWSSS